MAYIQRNTPPPNNILNFSLKNFTGGMNNRGELLAPNQASAIVNLEFNDDNVLDKRTGSTSFDSFVLPSAVQFIDEFRPYNGAPDVLIRATATELYFGTTLAHTLNGQMTGKNYQGKYIFADGQKIYTFGIFPSASSLPYVEVIGTPILTNTIFQIANPPFGFTPLPKPEVKGKTVYNYTTGQVWYEPCQMEIEDVFKGANILPESPRYITTHRGRMYASGSDRDNDVVYIADINNPYYYPVTNSLQLPPNSDRIVGLHVFDDAVVCGRVEDIYAVTGQTNNPDLGLPRFQLNRLNAHAGWANHEAVNSAHNLLFYVGSDGNMYALSGAQGESDSLRSTLISRTLDLSKDPINLVRDDLFEATSVFFQDVWYVSIKDKVLVYSYKHQAWSMYTGLNATSAFTFPTLLIWGDELGRTNQPSEDYMDYGVPYEAYYTSGNFDFNDANSFKHFREFFIVAETFDEFRSDIRMTFEIDYEDIIGAVIIANQVAVFGETDFGDRFVSRNINASLPFIIGRRGRNMRFTYRNGYTPQGSVATATDLLTYPERAEGTLLKVLDENAYYLYTSYMWEKQEEIDLNQPMRVYQVNGDYEMRGKR